LALLLRSALLLLTLLRGLHSAHGALLLGLCTLLLLLSLLLRLVGTLLLLLRLLLLEVSARLLLSLLLGSAFLLLLLSELSVCEIVVSAIRIVSLRSRSIRGAGVEVAVGASLRGQRVSRLRSESAVEVRSIVRLCASRHSVAVRVVVQRSAESRVRVRGSEQLSGRVSGGNGSGQLRLRMDVRRLGANRRRSAGGARERAAGCVAAANRQKKHKTKTKRKTKKEPQRQSAQDSQRAAAKQKRRRERACF
jgi:hypothetical protein